MDQVTEEELDLISAMETQPEAAGLKEETPTTTGQNITHSDLTDKENMEDTRVGKISPSKEGGEAKHREGKKTQTLTFYHRQHENKTENKPKEDEENLEDPPGTSNSPGLPRAEDNGASTASPDNELEK